MIPVPVVSVSVLFPALFFAERAVARLLLLDGTNASDKKLHTTKEQKLLSLLLWNMKISILVMLLPFVYVFTKYFQATTKSASEWFILRSIINRLEQFRIAKYSSWGHTHSYQEETLQESHIYQHSKPELSSDAKRFDWINHWLSQCWAVSVMWTCGHSYH